MEFLRQIWGFLQSLNFEVKNIIEILLMAVLIYYGLVWIQNTRAFFLLRGIIVLLIFVVLAGILQLSVISYLAREMLTWIVFALLVIFQPELRAGLEQLGQKNVFRKLIPLNGGKVSETAEAYTPAVTEELVKGCFAMSKSRTGALIVLERQIPLEEYAKTGIAVDAVISGALLINIFEKNTPLHDGAVVCKGSRIVSATCYLPLSSNMDINKNLGTRHRAAIGVSEATDSLTIVVSEETGAVSMAVGGVLKHNLTPDELRAELSVMEKADENETAAFRKSLLGRLLYGFRKDSEETEREEKEEGREEARS